MSLQRWLDEREPCELTHLDAAACGRVSAAVLAAEVGHLRREADVGGYVAEALAEEDDLAAGRQALGRLVGLDGDQVAFTDSGGTAFSVLLEAWPLPARARVGTVAGEYGANAAVLRSLSRQRGWELVPLPVDPWGRVIDVPGGLDLLTFPQIASQRGIEQPVCAVLEKGVPLVLDVAQSLGQSAVPPGCAAYIGTSRKWLCGPRGVGFAIIDPSYEPSLASPPTLAPTAHTAVRRFESAEGHIGGRVGLAVAAQQWSPDAIPVAHGLAAQLRALLANDSRWVVIEPVEEPTAITTLTLRTRDPFDVRIRLLDRKRLTSAVPAARAADLSGPVLRISTAAWLSTEDLEGFLVDLRSVT